MDYKNRLYIPIFCTVGLTVLGIFVFKIFLFDWFKSYITQELDAQLTTSIELLKRSNIKPETTSLERYLDTIPVTNREHRYTIIDIEGNVLADSSLPSSLVITMDNHKSRTEINNAFSSGKGNSIRFSDTLGYDLIYIAKRFEYNNMVGVMRIAAPIKTLNTIVFELTLILILLMSFVLLIVILMAFFTNKYIHQQLQKDLKFQEVQIFNRTQHIELLQRLTNMLAACNSIGEAEQVIKDLVPRMLGPLNGAVSLIHSGKKQLNIDLDWGGEWPGALTYFMDDCWGLRKGKFHLANDELSNLPCPHMEAVGKDQTLCIPLTAQGHTIGMMHLYLAKEKLENDHLQLCFTVAEHIGLALANLILQEKLREQAIRDPLTSLYNRRYMEESMEQEVMRAKRKSLPFTLLAFDIDHFKKFNDQYGHDAGDYVLKTLGNLLVNSIRREDTACRTGGEELSILLPGVNTRDATLVAEKLGEKIRNLSLTYNNQSLGQLTTSIGIASYPEHGDDIISLQKQADIALYSAKEQGRDQYCIAASMVANTTDQSKSCSDVTNKENEPAAETIESSDINSTKLKNEISSESVHSKYTESID